MDWRELIKPDLIKTLLFLILGAVLFTIEWWWIPKCCDWMYFQGLPLPIYYWGGFAGFPKTFVLANFVFDMLIWYFIAIIISLLINKFKN